MTDIIQGLPEGTLPDQTAEDAAASKPVIPGTNMPLPPTVAGDPNAVPAPDIKYAPGSLADKISQAWLTHIASRQPAPPANSEEGQRSRAQQSAGVLTDATKALGDVAHAHDTPGGWLTGAANVLNAREQRLSAEDQRKFNQQEEKRKNDALTAKTAAETLALHRNIYQQDQAIRDSAYKGNQGFADAYRVNHDIEDGVTHDELMKRFQSDKDFPTKYFVRATSEEPVLDAEGMPRTDGNGNPITVPTYSIITRTTRDGEPDDKAVSADISAASQKYLGRSLPPNTKLTGLQYAAIDTQINSARNAANILNSTNGKELSPEQMKALSPFLTDPTIQGAISHVPGSAYAGLVEYQKNADLHLADLQKQATVAQQQGNQQALAKIQQQVSDITAEKQKVTNFAAQAITPKQIEDYNKKQDDTAMLADLQKKADGAHGEEAAAIAASTQKMLETGDYTDVQKKLLTRIHSQATAAAQASQNYKTQEEQKKAEVTNALAEGDTDALVNAALNYQLDPNKLYSMRKSTNAEFKAKMLRQDPTWSEATYKARYNMTEDIASRKSGSIGAAMENLNTFAGHTWDANGLIETLRNTNKPLLNAPLNKVREELGNDTIHPYEVALDAAATEYINFLNNQHAKTAADEKLVEELRNPKLAPSDAQNIMRQMAQTVAIRARSMNHRYGVVMGEGKNIPGLLEPETEQILKNFGIDPQEVYKGKNIPAVDSKTGKPLTPAPTTHVFDSKAWSAANPGKDVNAAIAAAKQQGYEVR